MCTESPAASESVASIPGSLSDACTEARTSIESYISSDRSKYQRMFVEIDTTNGDETYTLLKNSIPIVRMLVSDFASVRIVLPDSGAASLLRRDWVVEPESAQIIEISGLEEIPVDKEITEDALIIVAPRASEVKYLENIVDANTSIPVLVVNPDLVDMGVTGLSLNARTFRTRFIDTFKNVYFLKTYPWGVLLHAYPGNWGLWTDDPGSQIGFKLIATFQDRPSGDEIEDTLDGAEGTDNNSGMLDGMLKGLSKFLKVYSKG